MLRRNIRSNVRTLLISNICFCVKHLEELDSGEGLPKSGSPLGAQSDYWFPLTAGPVALQHRRYFGFYQRDERKKESLACFCNRDVPKTEHSQIALRRAPTSPVYWLPP